MTSSRTSDARTADNAAERRPVDRAQVVDFLCPAIYDLGPAKNVGALSFTEGVDEPPKYPVMFKNGALVVLTKTELLPCLDLELTELRDNLAQVMPSPQVNEVAAAKDLGLAPGSPTSRRCTATARRTIARSPRSTAALTPTARA